MRGHPDSPGGSVDELYVALYAELRALARARLRSGGRDAVLDTTALVHESYRRLSGSEGLQFPDRARFLGYAGSVMRSVIVDLSRRRQAQRRGGGAAHFTLTDAAGGGPGLPSDDEHVLAVHEALEEMAKVDERMARVVELRYFAGLTDAEIAEALGVADRTVRRDWEQARLFLLEALGR